MQVEGTRAQAQAIGVGGKVWQWDRRQDKWFDVAGVQEKFGVLPESIPDWLAVVGDSCSM